MKDRLRRWLRRCFPQPIPAMRYHARHLTWAALEDPRTGPLAIIEAPPSTYTGHALGSIRVWAPENERLAALNPDAMYVPVPAYTPAGIQTGTRPGGTEPAAAAAAPPAAILDPDDAVFDHALSWGAAWKAHERGDESAVQQWLDQGWLADAWWLRRSLAAAA